MTLRRLALLAAWSVLFVSQGARSCPSDEEIGGSPELRACTPEPTCSPYHLSTHLFTRLVPGTGELPNPVFNDGACHIVVKSPFNGGLRRYKLYTLPTDPSLGNGIYRTQATTVSNGTDWIQPLTSGNLALPGTIPGNWHYDVKCPDVSYDPPNPLVMYFQGGDSTGHHPGIGRAISTDDGYHWTVPNVHSVQQAVMYQSQQWEIDPHANPDSVDYYVDTPSVLKHTAMCRFPGNQDSTYSYLMAYTGRDIRYGGKIGIAYSHDGIDWTKRTENHPRPIYGNPVIVPEVCNGPGRAPWDSDTTCRPRLVADPCDPATIHLFYTGTAIRVPGTGLCSRIGLATSTDYGMTWVKYAQNPVLEISTNPSDWDDQSKHHYAASFVTPDETNTKLRMFYIGDDDGAAAPGLELGVADALWANLPRRAGYSCTSTPPPNRTEVVSDLRLAITPAPARETATVSFVLPAPEHVVVRVFDAAGRRVADVFEGSLSAGAHEMPIERNGLASGVYNVTVTAGDIRESVRVTWIR